MRRRARHRLIGAGVLVLIGVVGFPLLFDTQPRPIAVDIPIEIPDRNKVKPLPVPAQPAAQRAGGVRRPVAPRARARETRPTSRRPKPKRQPEAGPEPKPEPKPEPEARSQGRGQARTKPAAR